MLVYIQQAYKQNRSFIITQMPLPDTVTDFWRLVHDQSVSTIVMLNDMKTAEAEVN